MFPIQPQGLQKSADLFKINNEQTRANSVKYKIPGAPFPEQ
jgi:hypothetical protein